ncbi:MAG: hypothetical protein AVDCRST_MAG27-429 [uncultured Craurococcus sp.]|uniref:Uncharacterized protein n=1 Tax=uncultured Craurococcus sp. TaxID=1135998 RepID=A0A6J4HI03_9PROT|nr:MAG: hypothetical protein AVDCRST_MAG27-429 [uncultured Craurococcus sp.]
MERVPPSQAWQAAPAEPVSSWPWSVRTQLRRVWASSAGDQKYWLETSPFPSDREMERLP